MEGQRCVSEGSRLLQMAACASTGRETEWQMNFAVRADSPARHPRSVRAHGPQPCCHARPRMFSRA